MHKDLINIIIKSLHLNKKVSENTAKWLSHFGSPNLSAKKSSIPFIGDFFNFDKHSVINYYLSRIYRVLGYESIINDSFEGLVQS